MGTLFSNSKYPVHQFKKMFICFNQTAFNFVNNCSDVLGKGVQNSKQLFLYVLFNSKKDRLMVKQLLASEYQSSVQGTKLKPYFVLSVFIH